MAYVNEPIVTMLISLAPSSTSKVLLLLSRLPSVIEYTARGSAGFDISII